MSIVIVTFNEREKPKRKHRNLFLKKITTRKRVHDARFQYYSIKLIRD